MTLVEVLAGLALMGSVFAAILMAHGRLTRQHQSAGQRQAIVDATDKLLSDWWTEPIEVPCPARGRLPVTTAGGGKAYRWETRFSSRPLPEKLRNLDLRRVKVLVREAGAGMDEPAVLKLAIMAPETPPVGTEGEEQPDE